MNSIIAVLAVVAFVFYYFITDWQGRPTCHKAFMLGFLQWEEDHDMDSSNRTNSFPNINGKSADSLFAIRDQVGGYTNWANDYRYVPGLREDDPGDLVLMYFNRPTRWTWHAAPPTRFQEKAWMVVPLDFAQFRRVKGGGEMSERVSLEEFRSRLQRTLEYVRTNERPNWQTVVAEHTQFLDSIGK